MWGIRVEIIKNVLWAKAVVLNQVWFCLPQGTFWFSELYLGSRGGLLLSGWRPEMLLKPALYRTALPTKNYISLNVSGAIAEKPWVRELARFPKWCGNHSFGMAQSCIDLGVKNLLQIRNFFCWILLTSSGKWSSE